MDLHSVQDCLAHGVATEVDNRDGGRRSFVEELSGVCCAGDRLIRAAHSRCIVASEFVETAVECCQLSGGGCPTCILVESVVICLTVEARKHTRNKTKLGIICVSIVIVKGLVRCWLECWSCAWLFSGGHRRISSRS